MEFLKKHYEKILLSIVLLGLVGAALWLPKVIKEADDDSRMGANGPAVAKPLPKLDLTPERQAMQSVTNPRPIVLSGPHNLFSPVTWKRKPDGTLMKVLVEGPQALSITAIKPLFMTISYESAAGTGYYLNVQYQSGKRVPREYVKTNEKDKAGIFTVREAKGGTPEDPNELVLELADTRQMVSVTKAQPYQRVDSYTVDLKYEPDAKTFNKQKVNDTLIISGASYKIVAITNNEVRVVSDSTKKQTTIMWSGTATP